MTAKARLVHGRPYQRLRDVLLRAHSSNERMVREDLARRHLRGDGIEIGAWTHALRMPSGARRRLVDRADRETIMREDARLLELIHLTPDDVMPVDVVDDAERLAAFEDASLDFIVAAHVLEHLEDPIAALERMAQVIRPGGTLLLVLPDARRSFDAPRERTTVAHLLRDHEEGPQVSRRGHYEEWAAHLDGAKDDAVALSARADQYAREDARHHFHVWELEGFLALLLAIELPFSLLEARVNGREFAVVLRREDRARTRLGSAP